MSLSVREFEQVVHCNDPRVGLSAIIAIHSTALGPATGGCRMWNYASTEEAMTDVLRLAKGMTYKSAISNLKWGGGKAVIIGDPKAPKNPEMLKRFGEFVNRLGGNYISAKDVGISSDDLRVIKSETPHVLGIDGEPGSSGDPSPATSFGVYQGMKAAAKFTFGTDSLRGVKISLQGLGAVAWGLLEYLHTEGAFVFATDIDADKVRKAVTRFNIEGVSPDSIYDVPADIFSPNALGASVNAETLPRLKAKIIAGGANNQLATDEIGYAVMKRGITYAPDYAINAGGITNIYHESSAFPSYDAERSFKQVAEIHGTISLILERARAENLPTFIVADQIAEERVRAAQTR